MPRTQKKTTKRKTAAPVVDPPPSSRHRRELLVDPVLSADGPRIVSTDSVAASKSKGFFAEDSSDEKVELKKEAESDDDASMDDEPKNRSNKNPPEGDDDEEVDSDDDDDDMVISQLATKAPATKAKVDSDDDDDDDVEVVDVKSAKDPVTKTKVDSDDDDDDDEDDDVEVVDVKPAVGVAAAVAGSSTAEDGEAVPPVLDEAAMVAAQAAEEKKFTDLRSQRELDEFFDEHTTNKFESLPEYDPPKGFKDSVELFDYQKDGVRWLVAQERDEATRVSPFFKKTTRGFINVNQWWMNTLTRSLQKEDPISDRGSILADDMGLGKSLQTLGLILSNMPEEDEPRTTLIVCPKSVIAAWQMQVIKFVEEDSLQMEIYVGKDRQKVLNRIKRGNTIDLLVTTYETIQSDWKNYKEMLEEKEEAMAEKKMMASKKGKKKGRRNELDDAWGGGNDSEDDWEMDSDSSDDDDDYLPVAMMSKKAKRPSTWVFDIQFHRVVLDEAHRIRNGKTVSFEACSALSSTRRLAITGTPFVNKPSDIHSLVSWLNEGHLTSNPLVAAKAFERFVTQPIADRKVVGLSRVRSLMSVISLRRTKQLVADRLNLPEKTVEVVTVAWEDDEHKEIHDLLYTCSRNVFLNMIAAGGKTLYASFYQFFSLVLRVRQACCSGELIPEDAIEKARAAIELIEEAGTEGELNMDATEAQGLLSKLLSVLKDPEEKLPEDCGICLEVFAEDTAVVLRGCKHIFCHGCLEQVETTTCPLCRKRFKQSDRMSVEDIKAAIKKTKSKTKKNLVKAQIDDAAPKIKVLLAHIDNMAADEKGLIFSQFTSSLDLIEDALEEAGHTFTRIDGSVDSEGRLEAMRGLESEDGPRFMLVSLKAGGEGITLTRASTCYLMDPWWNAAAQDQAMDRCHRIGQTRPVRVYQLVMEDSIEQRMLSVQEAKTALGNGSVRKLSKEESKKARLTALRDLFQVNIAEQNWHGHFDEDGEHDDGRDLDDFIVGDDVED